MSNKETIMQARTDIRAVDSVLHLLRCDCGGSMDFEEKLEIHKHIRHIENLRGRLLNKLFVAINNDFGSTT